MVCILHVIRTSLPIPPNYARTLNGKERLNPGRHLPSRFSSLLPPPLRPPSPATTHSPPYIRGCFITRVTRLSIVEQHKLLMQLGLASYSLRMSNSPSVHLPVFPAPSHCRGENELRGGMGGMVVLRHQNKQKKTISLPIFPPLAISFNPSYSHPSALSVLLDVVLVLTTLRWQRKIVEGRKEGVEMLMLRRLRPSTSRVASTRHSIPSILYPSFHHSPPKKGTKLLQPNAWLLFAPT